MVALMTRELHLRKVIKEAVKKADEIIMEGSDGSKEETDFLTGEVALIFMGKAMASLRGNLLRRELVEKLQSNKG